MTRFAVKTLLAPSGERLPALVDRSTGLPAFYPNLYVLTELRQTNRASATIERALREIMVLLDFLADADVDLADRIRGGHLLTLGEIDGLARHCRQSAKLSQMQSKEADGAVSPGSARVHRLRSKRACPPKTVSFPTAANRLRTIHAYLLWLIVLRLSHTSQRDVVRTSLEQVKANVLPILLARIPEAKGRNTLGLRQGLSPETLERLLTVVDPESQDNPWKSAFARKRNALIAYWLSQLGLRRGELLNIKIPDIDFHKNEVIIARRADDPEDPRRNQPKVKTRDRKLPLCIELAKLTHQFIMSDRLQIPNARKHGYLFVAEHSGAPISLSSLSKIFQRLRSRIPDLPDDLSAHVLRHTWNDEFSRMLDGKEIPDAQEEKMRCYWMGWASPNTAKRYNKRHIEKKASQFSVELQTKMAAMKNDK